MSGRIPRELRFPHSTYNICEWRTHGRKSQDSEYKAWECPSGLENQRVLTSRIGSLYLRTFSSSGSVISFLIA
jgi:hypothetical protein